LKLELDENQSNIHILSRKINSGKRLYFVKFPLIASAPVLKNQADEKQNARKNALNASRSKSRIDSKYLRDTNFKMEDQSPFHSHNLSFLNAVQDQKSATNPRESVGDPNFKTPKKPALEVRSDSEENDENIPSSEENNPLSKLMSKLS